MCGGVRGSGHGCRAGRPPLSSVEAPDIVLSQLRWLRAGVNAVPCHASAPRRVRYLNKKRKSIHPRVSGQRCHSFPALGGGDAAGLPAQPEPSRGYPCLHPPGPPSPQPEERSSPWPPPARPSRGARRRDAREAPLPEGCSSC